jgi:hypothetical protein
VSRPQNAMRRPLERGRMLKLLMAGTLSVAAPAAMPSGVALLLLGGGAALTVLV